MSESTSLAMSGMICLCCSFAMCVCCAISVAWALGYLCTWFPGVAALCPAGGADAAAGADSAASVDCKAIVKAACAKMSSSKRQKCISDRKKTCMLQEGATWVTKAPVGVPVGYTQQLRTNYPGGDIKKSTVSSVQACATACSKDKKCGLFVVQPYSSASGKYACWLKKPSVYQKANQNTDDAYLLNDTYLKNGLVGHWRTASGKTSKAGGGAQLESGTTYLMQTTIGDTKLFLCVKFPYQPRTGVGTKWPTVIGLTSKATPGFTFESKTEGKWLISCVTSSGKMSAIPTTFYMTADNNRVMFFADASKATLWTAHVGSKGTTFSSPSGKYAKFTAFPNNALPSSFDIQDHVLSTLVSSASQATSFVPEAL